MTNTRKQQIADLLAGCVDHLGGQRAAATFVGVSPATVSNMLVPDKWDVISEEMWRKVSSKLDNERDDTWVTIPGMYNTRVLKTTFDDARRNKMYIGVSHDAGSGKTEASRQYAAAHRGQAVYLIRCREWRRRNFLLHLCRTLGIETPRRYATADDLLELIVDFFLVRADRHPLLIIDEADKLDAAALRVLIPLYNETEGRMGVVVMGTENLRRTIKNGVTYSKKGYDEIDSRFGRKYVTLYGATRADVNAICTANGIDDKTIQSRIWQSLEPVERVIGSQTTKMVTDLRRLKRVVMHEKLIAAAQ